MTSVGKERLVSPGHDHLLAMGDPAFVHLLHKDEFVQTLAQELLQRLLNVVLNQLFQIQIDLQSKISSLIACDHPR